MKKIAALLCCMLTLLSFTLTACRSNTVPPAIDEEEPPEEVSAADFEYVTSSSGDEIYITKYIGTAEQVVIPAEIDGLPVVSLKGDSSETGYVNEGVFEGSSIKTVSIPASVRAIGFRAFKNCKALRRVTIPAGSALKNVIDEAFMDCTALETLDLSQTDTLSLVGVSTFEGCISLMEIKLADTLATIDKRAFYGCYSLREIRLPRELEKLGAAAFAKCTLLKTVSVPAKVSLTAVQEPMFYENPDLKTIIFEEGRESIDGYAFFNITSEPEIFIPKSVTRFSGWTLFIHGNADLIFEGDCPELIKGQEALTGTPTVYYDPGTNGWDTCAWRDRFPLLPIE